MKKNLTEVVFILDRSGSMAGLVQDTIGGYNGMLEKQKKEPGEAVLTTVLFDDRVEVVCDRLPLSQAEPMTDKIYYVRGCTALLDAVGGTIRRISNQQKLLSPDERPEKTLFIITTDGMENASRVYTYEKVKRMVEKKKEKRGWEFIFLGANIDAAQVAGRFGVDAKRAARYAADSRGTGLNFRVMSRMVSAARASGSSADMRRAFEAEDMLAPIREDYEGRD